MGFIRLPFGFPLGLSVTATCLIDNIGCTGSIRGPAQRMTARIFSRISGL